MIKIVVEFEYEPPARPWWASDDARDPLDKALGVLAEFRIAALKDDAVKSLSIDMGGSVAVMKKDGVKL